MILTTTHSIEGKQIQEYLGIVSASTMGSFGGLFTNYQEAVENYKQIAMNELQKKANVVGANAVIGIDFHFATIGETSYSVVVIVTGTAVKL